MTSSSTGSRVGIRPIIAAIRTVPIPPKPGEHAAPAPVVPFITISREPYAGAQPFAQQLVAALNETDPGPLPWTCWDRELVEKVAHDHHLSKELIESIEDERHSYLTDFLSSLSLANSADAANADRAYESVAATIRALAARGHTVIVGRGGVFITRRMPGGIHIRLVAPFEHRVANLIRMRGTSPEEAPHLLRELERNRHIFYKRHWPAESLGPETFTLTINTAQVDLTTMIQMTQTLVRQHVPGK